MQEFYAREEQGHRSVEKNNNTINKRCDRFWFGSE